MHRHVGDHFDIDAEFAGLLGKYQSRQIISERILLPVDEVILGSDLQRVGDDGRATVRCGSQAHDMRTEIDVAIEPVSGGMTQGDVDAHE